MVRRTGWAVALALVACATPPRAARLAGGATVAPAGTVVRRGETLATVARRLGAPPAAVAQANGIKPRAALKPGTRLYPPSARPRAASARRLAWPARGRVTSSFGSRGGDAHDGIDIGAPAGSPVSAAAAGDVVFAARHGSYGNLVILAHGDGLMTVYAHHSANLVRTGQRVRRGQTIARVGHSGRARGAHLHFEVREHSRPLDPMRYLRRP